MELCAQFELSVNETLEYLKMLVHSIDFRSEYTVTHTVNTVSLAMYLGERFGLREELLEKLYLGSMLHDVGKISIPVSILESPERLDDEQMAIMRTHVIETDALIKGIVPEDICRIAVRHHEKLDGSGYPFGLRAAELSMPERIVAVADIVSALSSRRSYKEPFPAQRTIAILRGMSGGQLDSTVCDYMAENYDEIIAATEDARQDVIAKYQCIMTEYAELKARLDVKHS